MGTTRILESILGSLGVGGGTSGTAPPGSAEAAAEAGGTPGLQGMPGSHAGVSGQELIGMMGELIQQHGGLLGLMEQFKQKGLSEVFCSWVGLGENQQINPDQIQRVLGDERVARVAQRFGIDPAKASELISQYLPKVVDALTPMGKIHPNTAAGDTMPIKEDAED